MKLNLTREEVVAALRCCAKDMDCAGNCAFFGLNSPSEDCSQRKNNAAADLIENQQREIEALRWANEGLRYNLDSWANLAKMAVRANRVVRPYETTTEKTDVGGGVPATPKDDEICRAALDAFGAETQITMVFEEMAELQDVLCKFLRGRVDEDTRTHIAEEIADVEIMLCQMVMLFDREGQVEAFRQYKLERLAGRIKEKRNGN